MSMMAWNTFYYSALWESRVKSTASCRFSTNLCTIVGVYTNTYPLLISVLFHLWKIPKDAIAGTMKKTSNAVRFFDANILIYLKYVLSDHIYHNVTT